MFVDLHRITHKEILAFQNGTHSMAVGGSFRSQAGQGIFN